MASAKPRIKQIRTNAMNVAPPSMKYFFTVWWKLRTSRFSSAGSSATIGAATAVESTAVESTAVESTAVESTAVESASTSIDAESFAAISV